MDNVINFFGGIFNSLAAIPFGTLVTIALSVFGGLLVLFAVICALSARLRAADKRPVFHFVNAFTAVFFALMLTGTEVAQAAFFAAVFWLAGYLYYGALCAFTRCPSPRASRPANSVSALPPHEASRAERASLPAAESGVRLDHALSVADKLLLRQLSRADRQELEKIKTALTVIQVEGSPNPQECEIINNYFNALLKLMAKYGY